jgi:hypothetical protein
MWVVITDKVIQAERMLLQCIRLPNITQETRSNAAQTYQALWAAYEEKHAELNRDYPATNCYRYPWNTDLP